VGDSRFCAETWVRVENGLICVHDDSELKLMTDNCNHGDTTIVHIEHLIDGGEVIRGSIVEVSADKGDRVNHPGDGPPKPELSPTVEEETCPTACDVDQSEGEIGVSVAKAGPNAKAAISNAVGQPVEANL